MAKIQTDCSICSQEVKVPAKDLVIDSEEGEYIFVCPHCQAVVRRKYNKVIYELLRGAGVITISEVPDKLEESWNL